MNYRPYALLAELTYRCPLHCPYCSNPVTLNPNVVASAGPSGPTRSVAGGPPRALRTAQATPPELTTNEWARVFEQAAALGVLQIGFSGGEPLQRVDLAQVIRSGRDCGLYTNLITSGVGLTERRARELRHAGLDSAQVSFQGDEAELADTIAGARAHDTKIAAAAALRGAGVALSTNVVLHRRNIDRLSEIIDFIVSIGASRLELANTQFYGWAFLNRAQLLPTREQILRAREVAETAKLRLSHHLEIFYVLPDYFERLPKPCLNGWGTRYITVNPFGDVLPCPTATCIADLRFDNVRARSLDWIWRESESFNRFRGTEWMPAPCRDCPQKEIDFGGCRCQAALITGSAANTDPVCEFSPHRTLVDEAICSANGESDWTYRTNPEQARSSL